MSDKAAPDPAWEKIAHEHHPDCTADRCDPDCHIGGGASEKAAS